MPNALSAHPKDIQIFLHLGVKGPGRNRNRNPILPRGLYHQLRHKHRRPPSNAEPISSHVKVLRALTGFSAAHTTKCSARTDRPTHHAIIRSKRASKIIQVSITHESFILSIKSRAYISICLRQSLCQNVALFILNHLAGA